LVIETSKPVAVALGKTSQRQALDDVQNKAQRAFDMAHDQFLAGSVSNLDLLTAEQSLVSADAAVVSSDAALIQDQIAVFRGPRRRVAVVLNGRAHARRFADALCVTAGDTFSASRSRRSRPTSG
jgi:hypothetical protein